jgi:cytoskeleton protein RodZ
MASFGDSLRRERELRGLTLREIADTTRISVRFLQALEQERWDILPGGLFPKAFLRQYARHVGLDPDRVLADYAHARGEEAAPAPAPSRSRGPAPAWKRPWPWLSAGAIVAAVLLTRPPSERTAPAPAIAPAQPRATAEPVVDRVYPPPDAGEGRESALADHLVLSLSATQSCWVSVKADGQTVLNRVMVKGETETFQAKGELVLSVGNAGGLEFSVNDRPGLALGRSGEVKRNIVITKQSLPALVQDAAAGGSSRQS